MSKMDRFVRKGLCLQMLIGHMGNMNTWTDWTPFIPVEHCILTLFRGSWEFVRTYDEYTVFIDELKILIKTPFDRSSYSFKEQLRNINVVFVKSPIGNEFTAGYYLDFRILVILPWYGEPILAPVNFVTTEYVVDTIYEFSLSAVCYSIEPNNMLFCASLFFEQDSIQVTQHFSMTSTIDLFGTLNGAVISIVFANVFFKCS